jgi:hypothetical protein
MCTGAAEKKAAKKAAKRPRPDDDDDADDDENNIGPAGVVEDVDPSNDPVVGETPPSPSAPAKKLTRGPGFTTSPTCCLAASSRTPRR